MGIGILATPQLQSPHRIPPLHVVMSTVVTSATPPDPAPHQVSYLPPLLSKMFVMLGRRAGDGVNLSSF